MGWKTPATICTQRRCEGTCGHNPVLRTKVHCLSSWLQLYQRSSPIPAQSSQLSMKCMPHTTCHLPSRKRSLTIRPSCSLLTLAPSLSHSLSLSLPPSLRHHPAADCTRGRHLSVELCGVAAVEGVPEGHHLVQDAAQRPDIGLRSHTIFTPNIPQFAYAPGLVLMGVQHQPS